MRLQATTPDGAKVGDGVDIAVRPENLTLAPASGAGNAGTIRERVFLGNICEYSVALRGGATLRVQTHPLQQFSEGEAVTVTVDASQCSIFPREPAKAGLAAAA